MEGMGPAIGMWIRGTLFRPRTGPLSSGASAHLDMFRGVAAFFVLIAHWRMLLFLDGSQLKHLNIGLLFLYWVTKLGHQAVVVFFVLSGFLVGRTVLRPIWSKTWSTKRYLVHRLTRLEVVLIPALILCWIWDAAGIHIFHSPPVYMGTAGLVVLPYNVAQTLNLHVFLGNIAFLQTVFVHTFGSDDPLWSLTNEFWYYILFPCIVICFAGGFSWIKRVIAVLLLAILVSIFWVRGGNGILAGFLVWLFGAIVAVLPPPRWPASRFRSLAMAVAIALVLLQLIMTYIPFVIETTWDQDYILGILFAGLMYLSLHDPRPVSERYRRTAKYAAGMSYTLYVTHMPVLVFIAAWLGHRWSPDAKHLLIALGILPMPIAFAILVSMLFEKNTDRVRKKVEAIVGL